METMILSQTDQERIEINAIVFERYTRGSKENWFYFPTDFQKKVLMAYAANTAIESGLAEPEDIVCCNERIVLTGYLKNLKLAKPYNVFNRALDIINKEEDFHGSKLELEEKITLEYNSLSFFCEFFEMSIFNIDGYMLKRLGNKILLQFFSSNQPEFGDDLI